MATSKVGFSLVKSQLFSNRKRELELLVKLATSSKAIVVSAPEGTGKKALMAETISELENRGFTQLYINLAAYETPGDLAERLSAAKMMMLRHGGNLVKLAGAVAGLFRDSVGSGFVALGFNREKVFGLLEKALERKVARNPPRLHVAIRQNMFTWGMKMRNLVPGSSARRPLLVLNQAPVLRRWSCLGEKEHLEVHAFLNHIRSSVEAGKATVIFLNDEPLFFRWLQQVIPPRELLHIHLDDMAHDESFRCFLAMSRLEYESDIPGQVWQEIWEISKGRLGVVADLASKVSSIRREACPPSGAQLRLRVEAVWADVKAGWLQAARFDASQAELGAAKGKSNWGGLPVWSRDEFEAAARFVIASGGEVEIERLEGVIPLISLWSLIEHKILEVGASGRTVRAPRPGGLQAFQRLFP